MFTPNVSGCSFVLLPQSLRRVVVDTISPDARFFCAVLGRCMDWRYPIPYQDKQGATSCSPRQTIRRVDCEIRFTGDGPAAAGALRHRLPKGRNPSLGPPDRTCALACLHPPAQETANLWLFGPPIMVSMLAAGTRHPPPKFAFAMLTLASRFQRLCWLLAA